MKLRAVVVIAGALALLLGAGPARAVADGTPLAPAATASVFGSAIAVGNTLMEHDGQVNFALRIGGSDAAIDLADVPADAEVVRAFLFWAGTHDAIGGTDPAVDLELPNGAFFNELSISAAVAGETLSPFNRCVTRNHNIQGVPVPMFSCRREITFLLDALGPGGAVGNFHVEDVDASPGDCAFDPTTCQAKFAGWAVVVMWESQTEAVKRDLVLSDAFFALDEQGQSGPGGGFSSGIGPQFNIDGFTIGPTADGELTFMAFEGDAQLGVPPQDLPQNPQRCNDGQCADFVRLRTPQNMTFTRLTDATNRAGNLMNGSNNRSGGSHPGLDIDTFDIGPSGLNVLRSNDTQLTLQAGSGDGAADDGSGGSGELFLLGFTLLSVETFSPRFVNAGTEKVVLEPVAGAGETLNYILRLENSGSADALNAIVKDQLPAGVTYVPNSTTNTCGVASPDIAGQSPVLRAQGLNVQTLTIGERCEVRFRVTVNDGVADGTVLQNFFTIEATGVSPISVGPATTTIESAELGQPEKTVAVVGGGDPAPGSTLAYTIRIPNIGTRSAPGVTIADDLPPELQQLQVLSIPNGAVDQSNSGQNRLDIRNITIPAGTTAVITFTARIRPTVVSGVSVVNQADVDQPSLPAPLLTDDPTVNVTAQDPTVIVVASGLSLAGSTKTATDLNGGSLVAGDVVEFRVLVQKSGATPTVVDIADDLPLHVQGCVVTSTPPGGFLSCGPGGANGTGRVTGALATGGNATGEFVFQVTVAPTAPDGFLLQNTARLTPLADPAFFVDVSSAPLAVVARAVLSRSIKQAADTNGSPLRPGDLISWRITATNSGTQAATNVVITDDIQSDMSVTQVLDGGTQSGARLTWTLPTLAAGASVTVRFETRVNAGTANGTLLVNTATLTPNAPTPAFTTDRVVLRVVSAAVLSVTKTVADLGPAPFRPGDTVRYTLVVTNTGDGAATDVRITDAIDPSFAAVILSGGGQLSGNDVVFDSSSSPSLASLAPATSATLFFDARLASALPDNTLVQNQARTTASGLAPVLSDDPTTAAGGDPTNFAVTSQAALTLQKTFTDDNGGALLPGDSVTYTLRLDNSGDAPATATVVRDPLDPRLTFLSSPDGGTLAGSDVVFPATTVLPGVSRTLRLIVRVTTPLPNGTTIPNQANATSPDAAGVVSDDPSTAAPADPTVLTIESRPVFAPFTKTVTDLDGDGVFEPGDLVRFTLTVTNSGSENADAASITDVVPAELEDTVPGQGGVLSGGTIQWGLGILNAAAVATRTFDARIRRPLGDSVVVSNQARVSATNAPPVLSDDPATAIATDPTRFTVFSKPSVALEKTVIDANGAPVRPGDTLTYTLRVTARGGRSMGAFTVTDPVDANLTSVTPLDGGSVVAGDIVWSLPGLALDASTDVRFTAVVRAPLQNGTVIDNQARAVPAEPGVPGAPFLSDDPATAAALDPTRVQVVSAANLAVTTMESTDDGGVPVTTRRPGERVHYATSVQNNGDAPALDVTVTIPVPPGLVFVAAAGGALVGGTVRFDRSGVPALATVNPGDTVLLDVTWLVASPLDDGTVISAQASLGALGLAAPFVSDDPSTAPLGDPTTFVIQSAPNVSRFDKSVADEGAAPFEPGDVIRYTLTLENTGDAIARNSVITDVLPAELEVVDAGGAAVAGNTLTFAVGDVAPGPAVTRTVLARVRPTVAGGTAVTNQARFDAGGVPALLSNDPQTPTPLDPTVFVVTAVPRLLVTKDVDGSRVRAPDDILTYTITVTSSGTGPTAPALLVDAVPPGLVDVTPGPGASFDGGSNTVGAAVPALAPGASATFTFSARVATSVATGTALANQAVVTGPDTGTVLSDDPTTAAALDPTVVVIDATPLLATSTKVAVDENGGLLAPGDTVRFVLTVTNSGNGLARAVRVVDEVDARFEILAVEDGGVRAGNTILWDETGDPRLAAIARGALVDLAFTARVRTDVADNTVLENQGQITSLDVPGVTLTDDPATAAASDPTRVTVRAAILAFDKSFTDENGGAFEPGDAFVYALRVRNSGGAPLTGAVLTDTLPSEMTLPAVQDGGTLTAGVARWALADLGPGGEVTVSVRGVLDALAPGGLIVENQAELTAPQLPNALASNDPTTPAPNDPTRAVVSAQEAFEGTVELFDGTTGAPIVDAVIPGQRVRARIRFTNTGTQTALAVVLRAPFSADRLAIDETTGGGVILADAVQWTASQNPAFTQMAPGQTLEVEMEGVIASPIPDNIEIPVFGLVTSVTTAAPVTIGPALLRTKSRPALSATTKEVFDLDGGLVEPGDVLTYRITVLNDGGAVADGVVVRDAIPGGTVYLPGTTRVRGAPVLDVDGQPPTQAGLALGALEAGQAAVVEMQVRVTPEAPRGLRIDNQAFLSASGVADAASDNPATPLITGDPTPVVVGGGASLVVQKIATRAVARVSEPLRFEIHVENVGTEPATDIEIVDSTPVGTTLRAGTLRIDGGVVTDGADRDDAELDGALVRARRALLEAGEGMTLSFEVNVRDGTTSVSNQASVTSSAGAVLSDGDPALPGVQRTVVPVEGQRALLFDADTAALTDENGGVLEGGDAVSVTATVRNLSSETARLDAVDLELSNQLAVQLDSLTDARFFFDEPRRRLRLADAGGIDLEPGASLNVRFSALVAADVRTGDAVRVVASAHAVSLDGQLERPIDLGTDALTVGLVPGTGAIEGTLFLDGGERDGVFDPKADVRVRGFSVLAFWREDTEPVQTAITDEDGRFRLVGVPAGRYRLEMRSPSGAAFGDTNVEPLEDGEVRENDVELSATGSIYRTDGERAAQGVRVFLFQDDGDIDPLNDRPVLAARLGQGQQGQAVSAQGLYRFDAPRGRYRIGIVPEDPLTTFPSAEVPVAPSNDGHPLGALVEPNDRGDISTLALVTRGREAPYTLRFEIDEATPLIQRNHIPVDALKQQVLVTKTANRKRVSVGDIVNYAIRVDNRALAGVSLGQGGVELVDTLPAGLRLIEGSYRLDRIEKDKKGQERRRQEDIKQRGTRTMTFGPFAMRPSTTYELRYNVVIGPATPAGEHENTAALRMAEGQVPLSERVGARVQVVPDAIFDLGTVRAKVFCDDDGDGWQDAGELGLPGARLYVDVGSYAEVDSEGKAHFTALPPGMHMVKLDERTLPPGASIANPRQTFYLSSGLPAQVAFAARCTVTQNANVSVTLNEDAYRPDGSARSRTFAIAGTTTPPRVAVDGVDLALPRVDLGLAMDGVAMEGLAVKGTVGGAARARAQDLAFAGAPGPNLPALVDGALRPRLVLVPRIEGPAPVAWQLVVTAGSAEPVWIFAGQGAPPDKLFFDGRDPSTGRPLLADNTRYEATLTVGFPGGDRASSAPRPFGVRLGVAPTAAAEAAPAGDELGSIDEAGGSLFSASGRPTRRLLAWLGERAAQVRDAGGVVTVTVHTDATGDAAESLTAERAAAVTRALSGYGIEADRLRARGAGDKEPKVPNLRKKDRVKNRRVVLGLQAAPVEILPPVAERAATAGVRVAGAPVTAPEGNAFTASTTLPLGGALSVEVVGASGSVVRVMRPVEDGPVAASVSPAAAQGPEVPVSWAPGGPLSLGGELVEIAPLLSARIDTAERTADGRARIADSGATALVLDAPGLAVTSWSVAVVEELNAAGAGDLDAQPGRTIWEESGDGALPPQVLWDGTGLDKKRAATPGAALRLRLVARTDAGHVAISPDVRALVAPAAPGLSAREAPLALKDPFAGSSPAARERVSKAASAALAALGQAEASSSARIEITVHTDDQAPRLARHALTQRQAEAMKQVLVDAGIAAERITAVGRGSDEPLAPNAGKKGRARNRRADVVVVRSAAPDAAVVAAAPPAVRVNGRVMPSDAGTFRGAAPALTSGELIVDARAADGARATVRVRPGSGTVWQGDASAFDAWTRATLPVASEIADAGTAPVEAPAAQAALTPEQADAGPATWAPDAKSVRASTLVLDLPPSLVLGSDRVLVRGKTAPDNRVRVGETDVAVDPLTGRFSTVAQVPEGDSMLRVTATDVLGNTGTIDTPVTVDTRGWFSLLMADTAAGQDGAMLDERSTYSSMTLGDAFVYGRGVAYVKGRFSGPALFRDYDLTLHGDTRRWQQDVFDRDVLDPDRFYPLYGDSSLEVVDGSAAGLPLHVALKADSSLLQVGSVRTQLQGGDLFRYARARPGAQLTFDRGWTGPMTFDDRKVGQPVTPLPTPETDPFRTTVTTFIEGGGGQRHARVELLGTGSSVYFMRHERIVEGSERVAVIVRDSITGSEIARTTLARNLDYTIRYDEGRILMKEPIGAFADAAFITNQNLGQVAAGNRVFIEVAYEHLDDDPFLGAAAGGQAKQVLFGHAEVGGGYVYEGREDGRLAYQLGGGHLKLFLDEGTFIRGELAGSQSVDAGNFVSFDGGLSYQSLGQGLETKDGRIGQQRYPADRQGFGFKLDGQAQLGGLLGRAKTDAIVRAYMQQLQPGYFADSNIVEQGQTKWGGEAAWQIWDPGKLRVRYDGVISLIPSSPPLTEFRTLQRQIATARYEHRVVAPLLLAAEYGYGYTHDSGAFGQSAIAQPRDFHTNVVAGGVDWQIIEALQVSLKQEGILTGDPNQLQDWNDHLITHALVKLRVTEDLSVLGGASVRWSGENQATAGVSWAVNNESRVYANERVGFLPQPGTGTMGFSSTSVVGAETELAPGSRGYAEYQLESAFAGQQSRGVAGIASMWRLPFGFALHFGYERILTLGGIVPPTENGTLPPGAFTDGTFYAAPGANGGGSFLYGEGSRDAFSVGVEFKRGETIVASQRFELRYDNLSEARGGKDRLWFLSGSSAAVRLSPELSLLARYNIGLAQDLALAMREAYLEDGVFGIAYRPVTHDWVSVLTKLSRRVDVRPLNLELGTVDDYTAHAVSLEPIVELPWKVQIAEKLAFKHARLLLDDVPEANALTGLWINRINWHLLSTLRGFGIDPLIPGEIDFGAEYRMLWGITSQTLEHGPLVELQVAPMPYFRLGVGWNFTRFSDEVLDRGDVDRSGFFVRAVGTF